MFNAVPDFAAYIASKHAVLGMTDNLREQMPDFIHVGLIIPGFVKSGLTENSTATPMDTDKFASIVLKQINDGQFYIVATRTTWFIYKSATPKSPELSRPTHLDTRETRNTTSEPCLRKRISNRQIR